jgi:hypothetical protein
MDLPELFARAGIQPEAADDLMTWARARTSALLATIDAKSPLGQSLAPGLAQLVMRHGPASESIVSAVPSPPPMTLAPRTSSSEAQVTRSETATRSAPRATARVISKPFLGAAVEAALQGGEASGNLSPETADASPPPPPPAAAPSEAEDDDASIGGFTRFGFTRRQPAATSERPSEARAPLAHGFALHAEREASQFTDVPAPPNFEASESGVRASLRHITGDSERSNSLVVGIPDDEGADVPMPRGRGGLSPGASGSGFRPPSGPTQENTLELNLRIEDPELSSALLAMIPANGETSTMLSAAASSALMRAPEVMGEPSLQITIDEGSAFVPVASVGEDEDEDGDEAISFREPEPQLLAARRAGRPPPPPPKRGPPSAPQPAAAPQAAAPEPEPAETVKPQRGRGRKKIVELSTPVVRPAARPSTPEPAAPRTTREAPRPEHAPIPNYLRDDDE